MDVTACIPGDIINSGDKLRNTPGAPEWWGGGIMKIHEHDYFLTILFNVKKQVFVLRVD